MATKLRSVLQNPRSRLLLKAAIFGGLYYLMQFGGFSLFFVGVFILGAVFLYSSPLFRTMELLRPLLLLLVVAPLTGWVLTGSGYFLPATLYFSFLFYLVLGVKDLTFIGRSRWQRAVNLGLAYPVLALFFYHNQNFWLINIAAVILALVFLFRETVKYRVAAWLLSLIMAEGLWVISLLPIGFINATNLAFLIYFVLADLSFHYYDSEGLKRRRILTDITIFILLSLAIFAFSRWSS